MVIEKILNPEISEIFPPQKLVDFILEKINNLKFQITIPNPIGFENRPKFAYTDIVVPVGVFDIPNTDQDEVFFKSILNKINNIVSLLKQKIKEKNQIIISLKFMKNHYSSTKDSQELDLNDFSLPEIKDIYSSCFGNIVGDMEFAHQNQITRGYSNTKIDFSEQGRVEIKFKLSGDKKFSDFLSLDEILVLYKEEIESGKEVLIATGKNTEKKYQYPETYLIDKLYVKYIGNGQYQLILRKFNAPQTESERKMEFVETIEVVSVS